MLAGVSVDYYLRLEQGRDRRPSIQVIEALARVLQLEVDATAYLVALSQPQPKAFRTRKEIVPAGIRQLLEVMGLPAFVEGRYFDVLAANPLAALSPRLVAGTTGCARCSWTRTKRLCIRSGTRLWREWSPESAGRSERTPPTPGLIQLVGDLAVTSEPFRKLWARHDVRARERAPTRIRHPQVGEMLLRREKLTIGGTDGQLLVVYHAERDSETAGMLALLGSVSATLSEPADGLG